MAFDEGLADRIRRTLPRGRSISERKMFGGLAFFLNGNMFCGVVKDHLMLRLGDDGAAVALQQPHVRPMDFTGRPMKSMVYVDARGIDRDDALSRWIDAALRYSKTLPRKK